MNASVAIAPALEKLPVDSVPTGIPNLDQALRIGGLARGFLHEIYGEASSGRSHTALQIAAAFQTQMMTVAIVDVENTLTNARIRSAGLTSSNTLICRTGDASVALEMATNLCEKHLIGLLVFNSVAALNVAPNTPLGELRDYALAMMLSRWIPKLAYHAFERKIIILLINQIRRSNYTGTIDSPGGSVFKSYVPVRIQVCRISEMNHNENGTMFRIVKNLFI